MDNFCTKYPTASEAILKNLDDKSLARSKKVSREISSFMDEKGRIFWIRSIKNLKEHFKGGEEYWKQVVNKTPVAVLRELAIASHRYFKIHNYTIVCTDKNGIAPPLYIAIVVDDLKLVKHILAKIGNKNHSNTVVCN